MCILLKLHYAKFDVSRLLCSKVIEEKPLGWARPPLGKGRVKITSSQDFICLANSNFLNLSLIKSEYVSVNSNWVHPPGKFFERANPGHQGNFYLSNSLPRGKK